MSAADHQFSDKHLDAYLDVSDQCLLVSHKAEQAMDELAVKHRNKEVSALLHFYNEALPLVGQERLHKCLRRHLPAAIAEPFIEEVTVDSQGSA